MYLIVGGGVKITRKTILEYSETTMELDSLGAGDFFGEMAIFKHVRRSATATAVGETEVEALSKEDLRDRFRENPDLAMRIFEKMSIRMRDVSDKLEELTREATISDWQIHDLLPWLSG